MSWARSATSAAPCFAYSFALLIASAPFCIAELPSSVMFTLLLRPKRQCTSVRVETASTRCAQFSNRCAAIHRGEQAGRWWAVMGSTEAHHVTQPCGLQRRDSLPAEHASYQLTYR